MHVVFRIGAVVTSQFLGSITRMTWTALVAFLCTATAGIDDAAAQAQPRRAAKRAAPAKRAAVDDDRPYGLERRVPWTTSQVFGTPEPPSPYRVEPVFTKLQFNLPVEMAIAPGLDRMFVVELDGKIYSFENDLNAEHADLFVDVAAAAGAFRVYGLAFPADFQSSREVYVSYVREGTEPDGTRVSRFKVTSLDPPTCDPASEEILITWLAGGHNGACLKFGADGYLYISTGDGTGPFPPDLHESGQDISDLLCSVLRIDVRRRDGDMRYAIPADNPFVDHEGARGEVFAYGFRNPWKMSFDPSTGGLWVGDVGWELWELVYHVERGGNYGWSIMEGRQPVHPEWKRGPTDISPPAADHPHTEARSITAGYVYAGDRLPELAGTFLYGDYETGKIWGIRHDGQKATWHQELVDSTVNIICFGQDAAGEVYVMDYAGGLYRLAPTPPADSTRAFPRKLSETGLFASTAEQTPADGVLTYSILAEPWADGATAERFAAIPDGQMTTDRFGWAPPAGTVAAKTVSAKVRAGETEVARRVETQLLHYEDLAWRAYTYAWNAEQTDATLVDAAGGMKTLRFDVDGRSASLEWRFSSRAECLLCHNTRSGTLLGFNPTQLDAPHDFGGVVDNQMRAYEHVGLFDDLAVKLNRKAPKIVHPFDASATLDERARSYLQINCAHCHRRGGGGNASIELLYERPLEQTAALAVRPGLGSFGIDQAAIIAPGDPFRSVMYYRMSTMGVGRMPHVGSAIVDERGARLIGDWIASLGRSAAASDRDAPPDAVPGGNGSGEKKLAASDVERLMASTSGALELMTAIDRGEVDDDARPAAVSTGAMHANAQIRGLFERFVPEDQRVKRLGSVVQPEEILALAGDAARGSQLFVLGQSAQCRNCHRAAGAGQAVGPDLDGVGKRLSRAELLESVLDPSKKIDPKFTSYTIQTADGQLLVGLVESQSTSEVVLRDSQAKEVRIAAADIELMVPQQKSFMPELLLRDMTAQEVADLLAYLESLR